MGELLALKCLAIRYSAVEDGSIYQDSRFPQANEDHPAVKERFWVDHRIKHQLRQHNEKSNKLDRGDRLLLLKDRGLHVS